MTDGNYCLYTAGVSPAGKRKAAQITKNTDTEHSPRQFSREKSNDSTEPLPDATSAAGKEKPHAISCVRFPVPSGDIEQPSFRDQSIEEGKEYVTFKWCSLQRKRKTHRLWFFEPG